MANDRKPTIPETEPYAHHSDEEEVFRRPRDRFQRQRDRDNEEIRQVFTTLGIDVDDVDSLRELAADLYYVRRLRQGHQSRVAMTWTSIITAVVSTLIGGLSVILSNLLHTGKPT